MPVEGFDMSVATGPSIHPRTLILVLGIVVVVIFGALALVLLSASSGGPSASGSSVSVHSHSGVVNAGFGAGSTGASTVYSHTGVVNGGQPRREGAVSVHSHAASVSADPTTTTPSFSVLANSTVFLFVSYVNAEAGGGYVAMVSDSLGDGYAPVVSSNALQNHTETLYQSSLIYENTTLSVSVDFAGGSTPMGGSVAAVDVVGAGIPTVDTAAVQTNSSGYTASVNLTTTQSGDLLLFGVAGQGRSAPYVAGPNETLLDTGTNTSGPFEDGTGYGTFSADEKGTSAELSARLAALPSVWEAIGVGLFGAAPSQLANTTTTSNFPVLEGSALFVFVGYVNDEAGGGLVFNVTDTLGDFFALDSSTQLAQNHTESLYVAEPVRENASDSVSVAFGDGATTMGGSVAVVDVGGFGTPTIDTFGTNSSSFGSVAGLSFTTGRSGDLLLLGVVGPGKTAPYTALDGEALLDTGTATSGPFEDGTGYGTFSATESGSSASLSATLNTPDLWDAIGVAVYGSSSPSGGPGTVTTPPLNVVSGSTLFVFAGYVNSVASGGYIGTIYDSFGDTFEFALSTNGNFNHTETLYEASLVRQSGSDDVSVTFTGGATTMGGSVAAIDVVGVSSPLIDTINSDGGVWSGTAAVNVETHNSSDLMLLGVSGMGRAAPFVAGPGETLLDTGTNTSGPFEDGTGYGTFSAPETGTSANLSATLATPAEWLAIGIGVYASGMGPNSQALLPGVVIATGTSAAVVVAVWVRFP